MEVQNAINFITEKYWTTCLGLEFKCYVNLHANKKNRWQIISKLTDFRDALYSVQSAVARLIFFYLYLKAKHMCLPKYETNKFPTMPRAWTFKILLTAKVVNWHFLRWMFSVVLILTTTSLRNFLAKCQLSWLLKK